MTRDTIAEHSQASRELRTRIEGVRRRYRRTATLTGAAAAVAVILAWLCISCTLDYTLMLQWSLRALLLGATLAIAVFVIWRLAVRPLRMPLQDDHVALMIERALPAFRSRYISAVQLARETSSAEKSLVQALVAETAALARTQPFHAVTDKRRLRLACKLLAVIGVIALLLSAMAGEKLPPLVRRAMLSTEPVPRRTRIELLFTQRTLAIGDDLMISVKAGGMIPREGRAQLAFGGGRKQDVPLVADPQDRTRFSRLIRSLQEPFDLTIFLGDARTESLRVRVKPRPGVLAIEATETFPPYTKRAPERRSVTTLRLLAGSKLSLKVKSNTALSRGEIVLLGVDRENPLSKARLTPQRFNRAEAEGEIQIPAGNLTGLSLRLADEDGVESRSSTVYPIELIPDRVPEIKLVAPPRREELLTAGATLLLAFEGHDDFGIARARLHYAVDWTEASQHQTIEFDLGANRAKDLVRRFEWKIGQLRPAVKEGQVIDYWLELVDANDVTGPGTALLDHHQVRIVTPIEKRAELGARLSDAMEGLGETRANQEQLNQALGDFIFAKPGATP